MSSKQIILAVHGLGGHSGWFDNLKTELKKFDIDFYAYDLPGFGQNHALGQPPSHFTKGHVDSFHEWLDFVNNKYQELIAKYPDHKISILGHSLGAVLVSNLIIRPGDSLILSVPGYKGSAKTFNPNFVISTLFKYLVDKCLFARDVYVEMPVSEKMQDTPAMKDPLRVSSVTQTLLFEILQLGNFTKSNLKNISAPVLLVQIKDDQVVDNETQNQYFEKIASSNKSIKIFSGADHDWIWYPIREEIAFAIAIWLKSL
jgi:acylglycerol lipase